MRLRRAGGTPLPRRRPQVGPGLAGRGEPARCGWRGAATSERSASAQRSMGARRAGAPVFAFDRWGGLTIYTTGTCSSSRCPPPPAGRLSQLRAARRPQLRPHAQDHLTRTWLRPSPADPKRRGFPEPRPAPAPTRLPIGRRQPVRRFLPPRLRLSRQSPRSPRSTHCAYVARPPPPPPVRALSFSNPRLTHFSLPLARLSSNHWSKVPVRFRREFDTARQEETAASLGA